MEGEVYVVVAKEKNIEEENRQSEIESWKEKKEYEEKGKTKRKVQEEM